VGEKSKIGIFAMKYKWIENAAGWGFDEL